ncbi:flagellar motor protein MotS [Bacillaceae bacterium W0354]
MKPKRNKPKRGVPQWMVTYSDMVTLILVFFILLFSMSQIDAVKFKAVAESYQQKVIFDFFPSAIPLEQNINVEEKTDESDFPESGSENDQQEESIDKSDGAQFEEDELSNLLDEVESFLNNEGLSNVITANRTDRGVVLILQERVLFESGRAELIDDAIPFLNKVGALLNNINNFVKVEGHTDSRPISTFQYPSNWELSGSRASSVVRYFTENLNLDSTRFQAVGFADTRPIAENDGPENWQKNRRVEIVILDAKQGE